MVHPFEGERKRRQISKAREMCRPMSPTWATTEDLLRWWVPQVRSSEADVVRRARLAASAVEKHHALPTDAGDYAERCENDDAQHARVIKARRPRFLSSLNGCSLHGQG